MVIIVILTIKDYLDKGYDSIAWNKGGKLQEFIVLDNSIIKDRDIVYQKNKGEAKGAVETLADGKKVIHALDAPDFSTMAHEISHVFEGDLTEAEKKIVKDFGGSEPFARRFEKYLRDGKSPSPELETLFSKFKEWLTNIYQTLKGSPIAKKISPEIKNIFDRLLTEKQTPKEEVKVEETKTETPKVEEPSKVETKSEIPQEVKDKVKEVVDNNTDISDYFDREKKGNKKVITEDDLVKLDEPSKKAAEFKKLDKENDLFKDLMGCIWQ